MTRVSKMWVPLTETIIPSPKPVGMDSPDMMTSIVNWNRLASRFQIPDLMFHLQ